MLFFKAEDPIPADGQVKKVQLEIKDDELPEPDEQVLVYLTDATGGARVATDSDSGLQVSLTHFFSECKIFCLVNHYVQFKINVKINLY